MPASHRRTSASLDRPAAPRAAPAEPASPQSKPTLSPKSVNAFAVNQLSRGGSPRHRAPQIGSGGLPQKSAQYQSAARRVTLALVAAPIAIVTSYVMWQRVVMGNERKEIVRDEK